MHDNTRLVCNTSSYTRVHACHISSHVTIIYQWVHSYQIKDINLLLILCSTMTGIYNFDRKRTISLWSTHVEQQASSLVQLHKK